MASSSGFATICGEGAPGWSKELLESVDETEDPELAAFARLWGII